MKAVQRLRRWRETRRASFTVFLLVLSSIAIFRLPAAAQTAGKQRMHGHVPAAVTRLQPTGMLSSTTNLQLAIGLPLRNPEALTNLLRQIYDPASTNYHHYLTPEQFAERFGPTEQDYQAVIAFAKANGLQVTATHPNRVLLDVSGPVTNVERALQVTLRVYPHPTEQRTFYAPDTEPSLDLTVPILHISGLDNYALPQPRLQATPLNTMQKSTLPNAGSGPSGNYMGGDFRAAYVPDTTLTGSGQAVGLLQFDGYTASDISYYESLAGLPNVPLQNVLIDGASGNPNGSGGEVEVSLDIEMAISMAPGLSKVIVYMAPNSSPWVDLLNRMATDNLAKQLSCSWYQPGGAANPVTDQIFQQMAAQGQSFFNASGDYDAYTGLIDFPGDTPYLTQVGGTTLTTTGPGGALVSETVWNRNNGIGSGGGISTQYPIPDWQTNINMTPSQGSTTQRNVPDVALTAENIYVRANGRNYNTGGTSCSAPLWAGFAALVNQQALASGHAPAGFVTPAIYALGSSSNYTTCFHDITMGNNTSGSSPTKFYAVAGYDLCTGWGTPAGQNLINALANSEPLLVTPPAGFNSIGGVSGPFTVTSQSFTLTNAGINSLNWTLVNTSLWLNAAPSDGTLTPGGAAATVTVSLNTAASNLVVGTYSGTIWFTNLSDNVGQSRQFALSVISPPTITTQPTNQAVLDGATATFTVGVTGSLPLFYQWQDNGTNLTDGGNISGSTTTNLTISNVSATNVGTYTVIVTNYAGVAVSSNALLAITPSPPVIVTQPTNQTVFVGANVQFAVAALGNKPFSYQWQLDATNLIGATNATLTLANVQLTNAGSYSVLVTNAYGSTNSATAVLTVNPPPPCVPAPSGIAAWWPAEGNGNDIIGTNNATVPAGVTYAAGEVGQSFNFNGTANLTVTNSSSLNPTNQLTIECWVYPRARPPSQWSQTLIGKDNGCSVNRQYKLIVGDSPTTSGAGDFRAAVGVPGGFISLDGATVVQSNTWYHVAMTYDGTTLKLYVNGTPDGQMAVTGPIIITPELLRLGGDPAGCFSQYFFNGMIDEPSIYNHALSASEIQAIYATGSGGKCFTPVPPTITTQPANQTVTVGNTATFTVVAAGTLPLSYQWSFNTTNIAGATNATLTLTNAQLNQSGDYSVLVTNTYGSTNSVNASLTVNPPPPCDVPPSGLVAWWRAEGNAIDSINGNNGSPVGNLGYANGKVGQTFVFDNTSSYIPLPASPSLNLGANNGFTIECWIQPNSFNVNVSGAPIIEWDSASTDGLQLWAGGQLDANIIDTSGNPHSLGVSYVFDTNNFQHVAITYDKNSGWAVLYINGAVVATNNFGSITPQTTYPVNIGRRTGQLIGLNDTYGGLMDELSLYNRALSASEIQAIYITGSGGKCFTPVPPSITTQPTNQTVYVGNTATFTVAASGTSPLSYQWSFNTTNIVGATNATLALANVQLTNAGNYSVLVTNAYGLTNSVNAVLTVNPPPPCAPPPSGLVAWWRAEGNAFDSIGTNNGSPTGGIAYTNGEVGQAFVFNNSSSYIPLPASPSLNLGTGGGFTIECWIKPDAFDAISAGPIIEWDSATAAGLHFWPGASLFANIIDTSGNAHVIDFPYVFDTNNFQHVAVTYDKGSGRAALYINGAVVATNNLGSITPQTTYPVNIGRRTGEPIGLNDTYGGLMDELSLYNRALSASEIQAIYAVGSGGKCFTPVPPTITMQPTNLTVYVGSPATFTVVAGGTLPLSYQWSFNTTNIVGATNATLTLANVQLTNAGNYSVLVTNAYGLTNSVNAVLTVNPPPPCAPAPSGLVAWWRAENNAYDSIGTNNGSPTGGIAYTNGEVGQAFVFNNSSSYIPVPASPSLNLGTNGGFTIECWIKPNALDATVSGPLIEWDSATAAGLHFWPGASLFANIIDTSGNAHVIDFPHVFDTNNFQHVAVTYDKGSGRAALYINGAVVATNNLGSITPQTTYPINLGRRTGEPIGNGSTYGGLMDELSLYNRALSASEIQAIYTVGVSGKCFTPVPPTITTQPTNLTVNAGSPATFTVAASGTSPLSYQWRFNTTNLVGATNTTLTLANVQPTNGGIYAVAVSNAYGSTVSSNASLTVLVFPPSITTQPTNLTVYVGSPATFTVVAGGTLPLRYQWSFNTTNIVGATNATLALANVQLTNAGNYSVLVTNAYGLTNSVNAVLTVNPPPPCAPAPGGLVAWWRAESNANDSIGTNSGSPTGGITYSNGEVGQAFVFNNSTSYIPLPASPSLNLGTNGGFTIECWIQPNAFNNGSGAPIVEWDSSSTDGLQLWSGGVLVANLKDTSGVAHVIQTAGSVLKTNVIQHVALTYDKSSGNAFIYYNGAIATNKNFGNITPQTANSTYHLNIGRRTGQPIGNGSTYGGLMDELSLYNRALSSNEIAAIYNAASGGKCPPAPPFIATQPTNQVAAIGSTTAFTVAAGGTTLLSYRWRFNGTNIVGATNTTLALVNVQLTNAGTYSVMVTNAYGSALSSNAVLTVGTPPFITNQPASQRIALGCNPAFSVGADGSPTLLYQWWKGGSTLNGQTNSTVALTNVQAGDFTNYYVVVANLFGSATSSNAVLTLNHPPVAVQDIIQRLANSYVKMPVSTLLANDTDADGDALAVLGVSASSAAGATVLLSDNWVYYLPPFGYTNSDVFTYTNSDGYCGGTTTGYVLVQVMTASGPSHNFTIYVQPDGSARLVFVGVPGWTYRIQYADNLPPVIWNDLSTNTADAVGMFQFIDLPPTNSPTRFYRSVSP